MSHARTHLAIALILLTACSEGPLVGVSGEPPSALAIAPAPIPDVSGPWEWTRVEHLTLPTWVAELVAGIQAEGPVTQVRCASAGTMDLAQNGATFSGTAAKTWITCETNGGQQFQPPDAFLPMAVEDGRLAGVSLRFSLTNPVVTPCPQHGVITAVENGVATALRGAGRCLTPGHPRSESPVRLPPPPGGTSTTLHWDAIRP